MGDGQVCLREGPAGHCIRNCAGVCSPRFGNSQWKCRLEEDAAARRMGVQPVSGSVLDRHEAG